jgi:3-phenylpropionate/trans-cinnamate dioxygenase ferredoxin reductase component
MNAETRRDAGSVVIVGGGLAGFSAAEALRAFGHSGPLHIVESESAFYDRPPLSKELFTDQLGLANLEFVLPEKLDDLGIERHLDHSAAAVDPNGRTVRLDDGHSIHADTILLATGGRARRLAIPGSEHPAVRYLRTFTDAVGLRAAVDTGTRVVVIGAGLIGAELASSLVDAGAVVTLVDPAPLPLLPAVGELMAVHLHGMHEARGIRVLVGTPVAFEAHANSVEVVLDDGERIPTDLVVVGVGIVPNVELAVEAGLEVDNGIIVDANQRTSHPAVFAAGDCARHRDHDGQLRRREEHWEAAQISGRAAAAGMLGLPIEPSGAPWFWSDRHGVHLEATGRLNGPGEVIVRPEGTHPTVFVVDDGLLVGAASLNNANAVRAARRLIDQRIPVSPDELSDPSISLRSLLKVAR